MTEETAFQEWRNKKQKLLESAQLLNTQDALLVLAESAFLAGAAFQAERTMKVMGQASR